MITEGLGFAGLNGEKVTMKCTAGVVAADEGKAVSISASETVALAAANKSIVGRLEKVEDGFCTVSLKGCMEFACNDATLAPGDNVAVCADGAGGIKKTAVGNLDAYTLVSVISVDAVAHTAVILK